MELGDFHFYNELAEKYPESTIVYKDPRAIHRERFLSELLSRRKGLTLDIGCNDGRYAKYVEGEYVGMDAGLACLRRFKNQRVWAVAERLPFKDEAFDYILLFETLEHIWDRAQVLCECSRVLRRGGELILSAPYGSDPWDVLSGEAVWRYFEKYGVEEHDYLHGAFNQNYLRSLLQLFEFNVTTIKILTYKVKGTTRRHTIIAIANSTRAVTPPEGARAGP